MTADAILFNITLLLYLVSSVGYHLHLFGGSEKARKAGSIAVAVGLLAHTAAIGVYCSTFKGSVLTGSMPFSLVAYFIAAGQLLANLNRSWTSLGSLTMPLAFVSEFIADFAFTGGIGHPRGEGALRQHVMVLLLGFAAFALAFCLAVIYLLQVRLLKEKKIRGMFSRLPPLESVGTAAHWMAVIGFSMLTLGIVTGAIAAPRSWGEQWYTDARVLPSVLASVLAWLIYATYLGLSVLLGWRGLRTTYYLIAGFVVVLVAFMISGRPKVAAQAPQASSIPGVILVGEARKESQPHGSARYLPISHPAEPHDGLLLSLPQTSRP